MEWNEKLQLIIDYVENHLQCKEEPIDPQEISKIADCSFDFFQKTFSYMNNISFAEYVRARKMTLAGYDLKSTNMKVVDISYKYGYDSPTSFTKAFRQFHGVSPKEARQSQIKLRIFPKMQIYEKQHFSWRLEKKNDLRLIGKSIKVSRDHDSHYIEIPKFWDKCEKDGTFAQLISMDCGQPKGLIGLFGDYDQTTNEIEYSIMVISHHELIPEFHEIHIPHLTWAIFDCFGQVPQAIQNGWKYLYKEWLVQYPFQHAKAPELEWYSEGNHYDSHYLSQIWIPIIEEE